MKDACTSTFFPWPAVHMRSMAAPRVMVAAALMAMAQPGWAACNVTAQSVNFGNYIQFVNQPTDSTGNIGITCDASASYTISLSTGGSASYTPRVLTDGTHALDYNLYSDAGHGLIWGNGTGGTNSSVSATDTGGNHIVYGRIPARQIPSVGTYSDSIDVTVDF
jgi:spore coat protein U-like protein